MTPLDAAPEGQLEPPVARVSLAQLIDRAAADGSLSPTRRRDIVSSLRVFARVLDLDPAKSAAALAPYRARIAKVQLAAAGLSHKSWLNTLSNVKVAVGRYAGPEKGHPSLKDLLPAWARLRKAIAGDDRLLRGLSALFQWASRQAIEPSNISDAVLARFHVFKRDETFCRHPARLHRQTCYIWNKAVASVPGWPEIRLNLPDYDDRFSYPWSQFPRSFVADVESWAARMRQTGLFVTDGPPRPLAESTLATRKEQIRRFASALAKSGAPIESITNLAVLFELANFEAALRVYHARLGHKETPGLFEMIAGLITIAKYWVKVDAETLAVLKGFKSRANCRERALTPKNRERLRQITDPHVLIQLLDLPRRLIAMAYTQTAKATAARRLEANYQPSFRKAAIIFEIGFAIAFLLAIPLRIQNLQRLRLDIHFKYSRPDRKGKLCLLIPPGEVKNDLPIEVEVPPALRRMFETFCDVYRPLIATDGDPWLFPGETDGPKHQVTLRTQIKGYARRHGGVELNPHLFRHLSAYLWLKRHPGDYGTVARMLGHKNVQTSYMYYSGLEAMDAARLYDAHLLQLRDELLRGDRP